MPMSRPPLSSATKPAWSMPCSISWRTHGARPNSQRRLPLPERGRVGWGSLRGQARAMNSENDTISAEDRLIARFFQPIATHPGALGLSDDAAFITPPAGCDLVLKTDAIIGGVHFFADDAAHTVASKALRVDRKSTRLNSSHANISYA